MAPEIREKRQRVILLGNEALGRGLVEAGVHLVAAYPGTPSSEILPAVVRFGGELAPRPHCEWAVNEKVAVETALAASYTGKRTAAIMKQVGLNVALDPVMSAAYIGVKGGFCLISADDPGPYSSQTEQDSRLLAHFAKLPVLDPDSPAQARDLVKVAFELSERFELPVMLRPVLRVCHARQSMVLKKPQAVPRPASFPRDPLRWAAIPRQRLAQHQALNQKLVAIAQHLAGRADLNLWRRPPQGKKARLGILAAGVPAALARDALALLGLGVEDGPLPFLQVLAPFPLPGRPVARLLEACQKVLVLEETEPLLEMLAPERPKLLGRLTGHVPAAGELTPERVAEVLERALKECRLRQPKARPGVMAPVEAPPPRRPNLCPGCGHRNVFYAMRRAFPKGIFPGDIGCYTLGMNQGAVDTCHDMGASINFAAALSRVHQMDGATPPIVATIGDSTFYHSGTAGLINAVFNGSRFVLAILDNETTSMTGMQPTPESGQTADGHPGRRVDLLDLVRGCGVSRVREVDAYDLPGLLAALKEAWAFAQGPDGSVAVVVARHACVSHRREEAIPRPVRVAVKPDACVACGICLNLFNCPALKAGEDGKVAIDRQWCVDCGQCLAVCPHKALASAED